MLCQVAAVAKTDQQLIAAVMMLVLNPHLDPWVLPGALAEPVQGGTPLRSYTKAGCWRATAGGQSARPVASVYYCRYRASRASAQSRNCTQALGGRTYEGKRTFLDLSRQAHFILTGLQQVRGRGTRMHTHLEREDDEFGVLLHGPDGWGNVARLVGQSLLKQQSARVHAAAVQVDDSVHKAAHALQLWAAVLSSSACCLAFGSCLDTGGYQVVDSRVCGPSSRAVLA